MSPRRILSAALTAAALLTGPAPAEDPRTHDVRTPDVVQRAPPEGFDWLDAGLGAGMALGVAMMSTGVAVGLRRRSRG